MHAVRIIDEVRHVEALAQLGNVDYPVISNHEKPAPLSTRRESSHILVYPRAERGAHTSPDQFINIVCSDTVLESHHMIPVRCPGCKAAGG